ncbi:hypothetical protein BV22DRAFT_1004517 [Leucogyrophana mollusca]|uniref:Uncharacterized protein n=1 Tax=Leucogyrophana mollusca TaxID=85980 RepID=A0ACB8BTT9_9AGAM|nr:hypothetical protein BV22DRAFT_1004517 [Leucogyrophana mollusca]
MQLLYSMFVLLTAPVVVFACEGQCIVDITNEYLRRYTPVMLYVLQDMAEQISTDLVPPSARRASPITYFGPVLDAYNSTAYAGLENAIFPSYFHGKCQDADGVDPAGCPDPDCPIVCGTPGSMVHFYAKLRSIAFEQTTAMLANLTKPSSATYKEVEKLVMADVNTARRRTLDNLSRIIPSQGQTLSNKHGMRDIQQSLQGIMKQLPQLMGQKCGAPKLSRCSWEKAMKAYILSFP